jgi:tetrahydromethanopterin S-methyltransferase subunit E
MLYLLAIFCAPLALLFVGKWFQAILNFVLYATALVFAITIILFKLGFVAWLIGVVHAVLVINNRRAEKRSRALIEAMRQLDDGSHR